MLTVDYLHLCMHILAVEISSLANTPAGSMVIPSIHIQIKTLKRKPNIFMLLHPSRSKNRIINKKGDLLSVQWTSSLIPSSNLVYSIGRDITEIRNIQKKLMSHWQNRAKLFLKMNEDRISWMIFGTQFRDCPVKSVVNLRLRRTILPATPFHA